MAALCCSIFMPRLSLRNASQRKIRAITLLVSAQDVTPGGKGSVTITSLDVGPQETFPVRIDLRLLRPLQASSDVPIQIGLDGVLFDDLSFYGPDKLSSRRTMTLSEWEARRDRRYFKSVLAAGGPEKLRQEMLETLTHEADRPTLDVQVVRGGRATNFEPEKTVQFAFLHLPDSPVEPVDGMARISGNEARAPRLEVKNRSDRSIRHLEVGWILHDQSGREFLAGSVPAELNLAPGQQSRVFENSTLKFPQLGAQPLAIDGMTGFVSSVEFADGTLWIPTRNDLGLAAIAAGDGALGRRAAPGADLSQEGPEGFGRRTQQVLIMNLLKLLPMFAFLLASSAPAQQSNGPEQKPDVFLENNRPKKEKDSNTRTVEGTVKDASDNPLSSALVQLKDMKTSKIVTFVTKEDGKFAFHDLPMGNNFELLAKSGNLTAPVKKVSVYDTRKSVILNFQLTAAKQ